LMVTILPVIATLHVVEAAEHAFDPVADQLALALQGIAFAGQLLDLLFQASVFGSQTDGRLQQAVETLGQI